MGLIPLVPQFLSVCRFRFASAIVFCRPCCRRPSFVLFFTHGKNSFLCNKKAFCRLVSLHTSRQVVSPALHRKRQINCTEYKFYFNAVNLVTTPSLKLSAVAVVNRGKAIIILCQNFASYKTKIPPFAKIDFKALLAAIITPCQSIIIKQHICSI